MIRLITACVLLFAVAATGLTAQQSAATPKGKARTATGAAGDVSRKASFTGNPSSIVACAGDTWYNTHPLGASVRGTRIRIDVDGGEDFDAVATAVIMQQGAAAPNAQTRVQYQSNDDTDGVDPRLDFTLEFDANVVLSIGSFDGEFGCYLLKVDVRLP